MIEHADWTLEEIRSLKQFASEGMGRREIADELGRCETQVRRMCQTIGVRLKPQRNYDPENRDVGIASTIYEGLINDLINRMPPEQVADVREEGRREEPGTERAIRGQFAEKRLAA